MKYLSIIIIVLFFISCKWKSKIQDSTYKYTFYRYKIDEEIIKISYSTHSEGVMKDYLRYQDSAVKYSLLLHNIKK